MFSLPTGLYAYFSKKTIAVNPKNSIFVFTFLKKTFSLRTCKKMPKKACLRYHINICDAPCIGLINKEEYDKKIENVKLILSGKSRLLLNKMEKEMKIHYPRDAGRRRFVWLAQDDTDTEAAWHPLNIERRISISD